MSRGVVLSALLATSCAAAGPAISLEGAKFRVTGLAPSTIARASLAVYVTGAKDPLFGERRVEDGTLVFEPRFPLKPGLEYRAVFDIPGESRIERAFALPPPPVAQATVLRQVYPSGDLLPENLLKFYLYFSAPMARGDAYRRIHLIDSGGKEIDLPFLELGEELWDRTGTRLTLFFDPGRIKRGLKPREEEGPALEEGKSYVLAIDQSWKDAEGRPLKEPFRKIFRVGPPDDVQPDPKRWTLQAPAAGSKAPFTVVFNEPMDEGMLGRVVAVVDGEGKALAGRIEADQGETRWRFHPELPWRAGRYSLVADGVMEDLAGNSIARPFEIDVFRPVDRTISSKTVSIPFAVPR